MQIESYPSQLRDLVRQAKREGCVVGLVPTMGALHAGHISLIEAAREQCDKVVATIFVNPTQFGPNEDFEKYPRTLEDDLAKCDAAGADFVFTPNTAEMYLPSAQTSVAVTKLTQLLEGAVRPTHFDGVTTVVAKLFNIAEPDLAFFGQKDYQQQLIIRQMVTDLDFGLTIVTCPIIREADGLAMSSRNRYLSAEDRKRALILNQSLSSAAKQAAEGEDPQKIADAMSEAITATEGVELDYAVVVDGQALLPAMAGCVSAVALVAAKLGKTRLIDNRILQFR